MIIATLLKLVIFVSKPLKLAKQLTVERFYVSKALVSMFYCEHLMPLVVIYPD
jgi:hypothetical protein